MPKLEKGCGENLGSAALWRDGLKGEVVEVPGIMLPNSILLQPHFSNWRRKLSSADHVADLESPRKATLLAKSVEGSRELQLSSWVTGAC